MAWGGRETVCSPRRVAANAFCGAQQSGLPFASIHYCFSKNERWVGSEAPSVICLSSCLSVAMTTRHSQLLSMVGAPGTGPLTSIADSEIPGLCRATGQVSWYNYLEEKRNPSCAPGWRAEHHLDSSGMEATHFCTGSPEYIATELFVCCWMAPREPGAAPCSPRSSLPR